MTPKPLDPTSPRAPRASVPPLGNLLPRTARKATIDRLARRPMRSDLGFTGLATVSAVRVLALCVQCGRDPVDAHMLQFGCLETTRAFLDLADLTGNAWPDRVEVLRPCCMMISPDEHTLATLAECAIAGDRAGFSRQIEGYVRADRHDRLFDAAARFAALLHQSALAGRAPVERPGQ